MGSSTRIAQPLHCQQDRPEAPPSAHEKDRFGKTRHKETHTICFELLHGRKNRFPGKMLNRRDIDVFTKAEYTRPASISDAHF